ncbi:MAG: NAD(+) diphosphatase [Deltaproteobacteria bacterium]|nr:NAD(+) diphosphatase [Deltaproteobacteria bacterium]
MHRPAFVPHAAKDAFVLRTNVFVPGITTTAISGRLYVVHKQSLAVLLGDRPEVPTGPAGDGSLYLGTLDDAPCFARVLDEPAPPGGTELVPLRQLFGALSDEDFGVAGRALGLTSWDRDHRYCGRCGTATARSAAERSRVCPACAHPAYPRLSPAVIVAVERDGKILLARNARTRMPFHSVLAGFVEVGESLEGCVRREVTEEAGIELADIRYFGSQPWPLTNSLMIGFTARWARGELVEDPTEIAEAAWHAPDALPEVPGKLSIARALIDDFVRRHGA